MDLRNRNHRALLCLGVVTVIVAAIHVIRFVSKGDHGPVPASASEVSATGTGGQQAVSPSVKSGTTGRSKVTTRPAAAKTSKTKSTDHKQVRPTDRSRQSGSSRNTHKTTTPSKGASTK